MLPISVEQRGVIGLSLGLPPIRQNPIRSPTVVLFCSARCFSKTVHNYSFHGRDYWIRGGWEEVSEDSVTYSQFNYYSEPIRHVAHAYHCYECVAVQLVLPCIDVQCRTGYVVCGGVRSG